MSVAGQANKKAVYWSYQLTKKEMDIITNPVVSSIVTALQQALVEVCISMKWVKINTTQFKDVAESHKTNLGIYYQAFLEAPKYLLISGVLGIKSHTQQYD